MSPSGSGKAGRSTPAGTVPLPFASWAQRVGAWLIDGVLAAVVLIPTVIFALATAETTGVGTDGKDVTGVSNLGLVALLIGYGWSIGFQVWNRWVRQGRTGQSLGKKVMGIQLLLERTEEPIGVGMACLRDLGHGVDTVLFVGYLWPLWDPKRQTFADKILGTVVVTD